MDNSGRKLFLRVVFVLCIAIGSLASANAGDVIKIGTILNFTGPNAFIGPLFKSGIEMALGRSRLFCCRQEN